MPVLKPPNTQHDRADYGRGMINRATIAAATALLPVLVLTGCSTEAQERPDRAIEATRSPSPAQAPQAPSPTPEEPESTTSVLPSSCDALITPEQIAGIESQLRSWPEAETNPRATLQDLLGPKAYAALQGGSSQLYCTWAIPQSDGFSVVGMSVISEVTKTELIAALRDSFYSEVSVLGADAAFHRGQAEDHRYLADVAFTGNVQIAVVHSVAGDFVGKAVANVNTAASR